MSISQDYQPLTKTSQK